MQNCSSKIKSTCAELSVKCNISSQASLVAVQTVCSDFYEHQYYLTKDEAIKKDPSLEEMRNKSTSPKPPKRSKSKSTVAHTTKEWKAYEHVLPSAKTINNHKHVLAIQHEQDPAAALYQIQPGTKVTLHYDTTSSSKIDGDWPTLILIFSDKRRFPLRPIFFAYDDRAQIVHLIVESYNRLAATINADEHLVSAKMLWEKTTAIMTDSVSKNHKISEGTAEALQSAHVPYHLLCKSHTVEGFDWSILSVLASVEKELGFREKLQTINPAVKHFICGKTTIVEAVIHQF